MLYIVPGIVLGSCLMPDVDRYSLLNHLQLLQYQCRAYLFQNKTRQQAGACPSYHTAAGILTTLTKQRWQENGRVRTVAQSFSLHQFSSGVPAESFLFSLCERKSQQFQGSSLYNTLTLALELFRGPGCQNLGSTGGQWQVVKNLTGKALRKANTKQKKSMPVQRRTQINTSVGHPVHAKFFFLRSSTNYSYSVHTKVIFVSIQACVPIGAMQSNTSL